MRANRLSPVRVRQRSALRTPATHAPRLRVVPSDPSPVPALTVGERAKAAADKAKIEGLNAAKLLGIRAKKPAALARKKKGKR